MVTIDDVRATYAPSKPNQKSGDSPYGSLRASPEPMEPIPMPPERDSFSPPPTAPKPESLKRVRGDLMTSLNDCEHSLSEMEGMDIVERATATIRLAQRYRTQVQHEDWEDEKRLRRDAVDVLVILRDIAERGGRDVTAEEKGVITTWCTAVRTRVERDDEVRRRVWEGAASWMEGNWEGKEWGILSSSMRPLIQTDIIYSSVSSILHNLNCLSLLPDNFSTYYAQAQNSVSSIMH